MKHEKGLEMNQIGQQLWRWTRGVSVLGFGILGITMLARGAQTFSLETAQVGHESHRAQGQFGSQNIGDVPWVLAPAHAESGEEKLEFAVSDTAYIPKKAETDDYHCFVIQPGLKRDVMVTGVNVSPDNKRTVHHAILFKIDGDAKREALEKNNASGNKGWTCFGGPGVGGPAAGGNWVGAWAPGAGDGHFPDGVGIALPKDAIIVMQVHYNLANESGPDRSRVTLSLAPEGKKLTGLKTGLNIAPVELPCADDLKTPNCNRETIIVQNTAKFGPVAGLVSKFMLERCKQDVSKYQKSVGDASRLTGTCDREIKSDGTLYAVAGHMHLRGQSIKLELNPGTNAAKTLLHIPRWDFHWQGNYWFQTPVQIKKGDVLRITCMFDNSNANQPVIADKTLEPRYVVWGEGTTDEMCLGVTMERINPN
jgi:Copper type II ascorbate-dependent monooxygenase, N-terminal domain/Copper type II ascorbate-dependent monooxygenase, C-terminal domain